MKSVVVHYDEMGHSVGTADVVTDRASAEEIKSNFANVALDGPYQLCLKILPRFLFSCALMTCKGVKIFFSTSQE